MPPRYRIKSLDWSRDKEGPDGTSSVRSIVGYYAAWVHEVTAYCLKPGSTGREAVGTELAEAIAACQADFETRIESVLEAIPD